MNAPSAIAVVKARLPYIDRRALSQAWFSALHLAAEHRPGPRLPSPNAAQCDPLLARRRLAASGAAGYATPPRARLGAARAGAPARGALEVRVQQRSREAIAPLRPVSARSYPSARAAFTIGVDGARVALLIRREGATLHVVALCSVRHVELVRRALAGAEAALRASGDAVRAAVQAAEVRA